MTEMNEKSEEEMAEEYVNNKADKGNYDLEQFGKAYFSESSMKRAFLAGLKAKEKTQWHDLRKNSDDLPKYRHNVWIVYLNGYCHKSQTVASYRHKYWVINGHKTECEIIAWCELPKFEE